MPLNVSRLHMAMIDHWEAMDSRLHVCVGETCAEEIAAAYQRRSPSVTSSQEKTASGSAAPRKQRKAGERSR